MNRWAMLRILGSITIAVCLALAAASGAGARIMNNTIGPEATLSAGGHWAQGSVLLNCTAGQQVRFTLTLSQGDAPERAEAPAGAPESCPPTRSP
ncbi:MAG: hypothetical protein WEE64_14655 [Dehalococcoidia bacterium]